MSLSLGKLLAIAALALAILSLFLSGPMLLLAVICLALAMLV